MSNKSTKNIQLAFMLNLGFSIFELIGGLYVNSISIISDSIHDFGDSLSIGLSWLLDKKANKKPNEKFTYGYLRFSVLGALINSLILTIGSLIMIYNAVPRLISPQEINYNGVFKLAFVGLLANGYGAFKTSKGKAISEKVISLHLLEDVLGWASILICSIIMKIFDFPILDPILSIFISIFILFNVFKNIKKIFEVFLEKSPNNIDTNSIINSLKENKSIVDIHHIHIWTMDHINNYCTLHVVIKNDETTQSIIKIKEYIRNELKKYEIKHVTIEIEFNNELCDSSTFQP